MSTITAVALEHAGDPADLLALALSTPAAALDRARRTLRSGPADRDASYAHQAAGIVLRDRGELPAALSELRAALRSAVRADSAERVADVRATLGAAEVMAGRTRQGLARLEAAAAGSHGLLLATVRLRRAHVLSLLGRYDEALRDLRAALTVTRRSGDRLWEARILHNRYYVHLSTGALARADADAKAAGALFDELGQALESVQAAHNRANVTARRGDLPAALRLLDLAEQRYQLLGVLEPELVIDRGHALLAAGLAPEAVLTAEQAFSAGTAAPVDRAELLLFGARAALAADRPAQAQEWSRAAQRLFRLQQRPGWEQRARLLRCQARYLGGERTERLLTSVSGVATALGARRDDDAPLAWLLVARLAEERDQPARAADGLRKAARYRLRGPALGRASGWLAAAMEQAATGNQRGLLAACGRGLDALDEHRLLFGAAELRAIATWHGRDLAAFAVDAATRQGSARLMLTWTERSRAISLAEPSVRPEADPVLAQELAAVRESARRLELARQAGTATGPAQQQREHWESAIRTRRRQLSGATGSVPRIDIDALLATLGEATMLTMVESRGGLHLLQAGRGQVRRHEIGPVAVAARELEFALFALRRAAFGRPGRLTFAAGLQHSVLGVAAGRLGSGPVIVVPSTRFHAMPWGLLPALAGVPLTVAPSALVWQRATAVAATPCPGRRVLLVAGPDLGTRGAEIPDLAAVHPHAEVLGTAAGAVPAATVDRVVSRMHGAWVTHIAAHGDFRADSPLFSSLRLDDGALFVHDLDRVRQASRQVVLSACDTGVAKPVGTQEMLGLVSGLLRTGTASVLASVGPVNDPAAVPVMAGVHRALAQGRTLAEAALAGRREAAGDDLAASTAASFSVWGA